MSEQEVSRVTRPKSMARAFYNRMSSWYDLVAGSSESKYRNIGLSKLDIKQGEKVLEIGCGTGQCIVTMAECVGESGQVYGIDISDQMLKVACERVNRNDLSERVSLMCCDGVDLLFESGYFDAVFMSFTLELFDTPEIATVLRECRRVLNRDGRICVVAMSKRRHSTLAVRIYEWAHERFPNIIDCRPIYVRESLERNGYQIIEAEEMCIWGLPLEIVLAKRL
jgi:demethylmenaquinone methyltransferase/2-methoxy-6-polyprenyl-1,4-benzoquinol methylase